MFRNIWVDDATEGPSFDSETFRRNLHKLLGEKERAQLERQRWWVKYNRDLRLFLLECYTTLLR